MTILLFTLLKVALNTITLTFPSYYEKKNPVIVDNVTNINKTNNRLPPQTIEH